MDSQTIRQLAYETPRATKDIATPFWPGTDGQIAIADIGDDEAFALAKIAKDDPANYRATLICYTLVSRETGERIYGKRNDKGEFLPTDRDWLKGQKRNLAILTPQINDFLNGTIEEKKDTSTVQKDTQSSSGTD